MQELALSIEDFNKRYIEPEIERLWDLTRRELRRRRISRRAFLEMSSDERWTLMRAAQRRYGAGKPSD